MGQSFLFARNYFNSHWTNRSRATFALLAIATLLLLWNFTYRSKNRQEELNFRLARHVKVKYPSAPAVQRESTIFDDDFNISVVPPTKLSGFVDKSLLLRGHFDHNFRYKHFPNVFPALNESNLALEPVCVALQSTIDIVSGISRYLKNWPGHISYALFTPSHLFHVAVVFIKHLRRCHPEVHNQVSWHLSHPKLLPPLKKFIHILNMSFDCSTSDKRVLASLLSLVSPQNNSIPGTLLYPQNTMRNLARLHCKTEWVTCPDVDMIFPDPEPGKPDYLSRLRTFFRSEEATTCDKCAFVLPLYEVENLAEGRVPNSKRQLLQYVANHSAQVYHVSMFPRNQLSSNLSEWEKIPPRDEIQVALPINYIWYYEPVYIVQHGSPLFNERFIGYGMTRNSQALEMYLANYTFHLLDTIFLCHMWGLKSKAAEKMTGRLEFRKQQALHNSRVFYSHFARELAVQYDRDLGNLLHATDNRRRLKKKDNLRVRVRKPDNSTRDIFSFE